MYNFSTHQNILRQRMLVKLWVNSSAMLFGRGTHNLHWLGQGAGSIQYIYIYVYHLSTVKPHRIHNRSLRALSRFVSSLGVGTRMQMHASSIRSHQFPCGQRTQPLMDVPHLLAFFWEGFWGKYAHLGPASWRAKTSTAEAAAQR